MTVQQARAQFETAAAFIPQVEQQIVVTENAMSLLTGSNPGPIPRGKAIGELVLPPVPSGLPSDLLERRPDIAEAEQNLIAANAQIGAAKALYFPTISLTGFFGDTSNDLSNLFEGSAKTWNFTGSITGPIFTGGAVSGQVAQARAGQKIALSNYENAIENAFAEVENALSSRTKLIEAVAAKQRLVDALRGYAQLARLQYDGGYTSYLTVLDAQQQLFPAELDLALTSAQLLNSASEIYKATGGGWINAADQLAPQSEQGGWLSPEVGTASLPPDGGVATSAGDGAAGAAPAGATPVVTSPTAPPATSVVQPAPALSAPEAAALKSSAPVAGSTAPSAGQ
jgi:multidrug efflux system outer membrane protein